MAPKKRDITDWDGSIPKTASETYTCTLEDCNASYTRHWRLVNHARKQHNIDILLKQKLEKKPLVQTPQKKHHCTVLGCNASFFRPHRLEAHTRQHNNERPFKCDILGCDKSFTNSAHLKRHGITVHTHKEKDNSKYEVMCTVTGCGLVLSNKYSLKKHLTRRHKTPFECAECCQMFQQKRQLRKHILVHLGELPKYKCTRCRFRYHTVSDYDKHKKSHHKTYTCDCGEVFEKWSQFVVHRKTTCTIKNIEHKCPICNKILQTKSNLKAHTMTHVEDSQLEINHCPYLNCTRSYKYKKNLTYHIEAFHEKTKLKEIKCTEPGCEQILNSNKNFKQHLEKMHRKTVPKEKKLRRPRHDKGKPKKCMASFLSGIQLLFSEHKSILNATNQVNNASKACGLEENCKNSRSLILNQSNFLEFEQRAKQKFVTILCSMQLPLKKQIVEENKNLNKDDVLLQQCDEVLDILDKTLE